MRTPAATESSQARAAHHSPIFDPTRLGHCLPGGQRTRAGTGWQKGWKSAKGKEGVRGSMRSISIVRFFRGTEKFFLRRKEPAYPTNGLRLSVTMCIIVLETENGTAKGAAGQAPRDHLVRCLAPETPSTAGATPARPTRTTRSWSGAVGISWSTGFLKRELATALERAGPEEGRAALLPAPHALVRGAVQTQLRGAGRSTSSQGLCTHVDGGVHPGQS